MGDEQGKGVPVEGAKRKIFIELAVPAADLQDNLEYTGQRYTFSLVFDRSTCNSTYSITF